MKRLALLSLLVLAGCQSTNLLEDYTKHLDTANERLREHQIHIYQINEGTDPQARKQAIDNYVEWTSQSEQDLQAFLSFVTEHQDYLETQGKNTRLIKEGIQQALQDIKTNKESFNTYNRIWNRYNN